MGEGPSKLQPDRLGDDEVVTQRIAKGAGSPPVINAPRPKDQGRVSVIRGRKSPSQAYHLVRKGGSCGPDDGARYAEVGALRDAGFIVTHTPNNRNPDHCSVAYPSDWSEDVALLFEMCFADESWNAAAEDTDE
ncbi:hypothetical protein [Nocardioides xinjiangensis]|uniref:hypothetical protein n=1 Tax=Nocardioides xinjiangensis TaxID=2817376 RepID=UPI001B301795|nr:hypothetical protein [Nocardioides sp. SYSU D00778]